MYKLQLITEAKKTCPDVIIVLGEDLTRFRDASKSLYNFLRAYSWSDKVERLGFDEVWLDLTDLIDYNLDLLNSNNLSDSFFHLSSRDPTAGFGFDATQYAGHTFPIGAELSASHQSSLERRLMLGSHLALYMRQELHQQKGYTSTVGISTSKLLSKLAGNMNKPKGQTTLVPPYEDTFIPNPNGSEVTLNNVAAFMDPHDIGAVPWIGFKIAQKLREAVLGRLPEFTMGLVYGRSREAITVGMVRQAQGLDADLLEELLSGPGMGHQVGANVFRLIHGVDDSEVSQARNVPRQISIEDSYIQLDRMEQVSRELLSLSSRLIQRMRVDLLANDEGEGREWMAKPSTLRLSTRPRPPLNADGTRTRAFNRISKSASMPAFVFNTSEDVESIADRLIALILLPLFRKLHPERNGWNLSLVNVAATNMVESAADSKSATGRDIKGMFNRQNDVLSDFKITEPDHVCRSLRDDKSDELDIQQHLHGSESSADMEGVESTEDIGWHNDDSDEPEEDLSDEFTCTSCMQKIPTFAKLAHDRFHTAGG